MSIDHTCTSLKRDIRKLSHQPVSLRPQFQCTCYQLTSCILNEAQRWAGGGRGWVGGDMSMAVGWVDHLIILPSTCTQISQGTQRPEMRMKS